MPKPQSALAIPVESRILVLRDHKVILDTDLAELYGVSVKRLNEQVKRNEERFPADFMFQLTPTEHEALRSQFATSKQGRGGRRYPPYAFTEHGAIMAATVLNSERAVEMSVFVVRAFVRLRESLSRRVSEITLAKGGTPAVKLSGKTLLITFNPDAGYEGRASSRAIASALGTLLSVAQKQS